MILLSLPPHSQRHMQTCTNTHPQRVSHPGEELERCLTRRQERLHWLGGGHGWTSVLTSTCSYMIDPSYPLISLFYSLISLFLCMFLLPKPWSFLFPTSGSCPKHPTVSPVKFWNSLSIHPIVCSMSPGSGFPQCQRWLREQLPLPHGDRFPHPTVLRLLWGSPGGSEQGLFLWLVHWGFLHLLWAPVLLHGCGDGPLVGSWLGWNWKEMG